MRAPFVLVLVLALSGCAGGGAPNGGASSGAAAASSPTATHNPLLEGACTGGVPWSDDAAIVAGLTGNASVVAAGIAKALGQGAVVRAGDETHWRTRSGWLNLSVSDDGPGTAAYVQQAFYEGAKVSAASVGALLQDLGVDPQTVRPAPELAAAYEGENATGVLAQSWDGHGLTWRSGFGPMGVFWYTHGNSTRLVIDDLYAFAPGTQLVPASAANATAQAAARCALDRVPDTRGLRISGGRVPGIFVVNKTLAYTVLVSAEAASTNGPGWSVYVAVDAAKGSTLWATVTGPPRGCCAT